MHGKAIFPVLKESKLKTVLKNANFVIQILRTIPFDKVDIKIFDIEMNHVGQIFEGSASDLRRHLEKSGYEAFMRVGIDEVSLLGK